MDIGTALFFNTFGMILIVLYVVATSTDKLSSKYSWPHFFSFLCGALWTLADLAFYQLSALGGEVSTLAPITSLELVVPVFMGILFLGEPMTKRKLIGVFFAILGIYLLGEGS